MIETIKINTIDDVRKIFFDQEYDPRIGRHRNLFVYRGLPDPSYTLKTSLDRFCKNIKAELEDSILDNFAKYALLESPEIKESVWLKMILGQHHGLPTRLLDWSRSSLMALHFATTEGNYDLMDQRDCVVWRIDIEKINKLLPEKYLEVCHKHKQQVFSVEMLSEVCVDQHQYDQDMGSVSMVMLEPPTIDMRIANQYSFFSIVPSSVGMVEEIFAHCNEGVVRYVIDKNLRWEIRDMLDQVNINERIVYPGLDGIATWLGRHYFVRNLFKVNMKSMSIVNLEADIIVSPARPDMKVVGGATVAVCNAAGERIFKEKCTEFTKDGDRKNGEVLHSDGFNTKAKHILFTILQPWKSLEKEEGIHTLEKLYRKCLEQTIELGCHSIGFPLLGTGSGCDEETAWRVALKTCNDFLKTHRNSPLDITFCLVQEQTRNLGEKVWREEICMDKDYKYVEIDEKRWD